MGAASNTARFESDYSRPVPTSSGHSVSSHPKPAKIDTNFFEINLNILKLIPSFPKVNPSICESCGSILNHTSLISLENTSWTCTFCLTPNRIIENLETFQISSQSEENFILEDPNSEARSTDTTYQSNQDSTSVIFCIDISGSMCLKKKIQSNSGLSSQFSMISRLQCVQTAIESQLSNLKEKYPNKKVGIVCFNNDVIILGDGSQSETVPANILKSFDELMDYSQNQRGKFLNLPVSHSFDLIKSNLMSLKAKGGTALGPGLLVSVILASDAGPGSQVVICTDGLANVGVGDLSSENAINDFYKEIGSIAKELGVSVSVVTIEGQDCRLEALNLVTFETQGDIVRVAPETLASQFAEIMAQEVVATQVQVEIFLHNSIEFFNEKPKHLMNDGSILRKFIGNANEMTSFSFQYALKSDERLQKLGIVKSEIKEIPVQASFRFKAPDGRRYLKVITKVQKVVFDQDVDAASIDPQILMRAARRNVISLVEEGKFQEAKTQLDAWKGLVVDGSNREEFLNDIQAIERNIDLYLAGDSSKGLNDEFVAMNQLMKKKR